MVDAVRIMSGDDLVGYMVVMLEPDYLLSNFSPDYSQLGYIGLSQYNGRQAPNILAELGDRSLAGEVPERQSVPGTLFRVEFPSQHYTAALGGRGTLLALLLAGVFFLAGATVLYINNRKLAKVNPVARRVAAIVPAARADLDKPAARDIAVAPRIEGKQSGDAPEVIDAEFEPPPMHLRYDIAERRKVKEAAHQPIDLSADIFRAYDIRGVIGKTLDTGIARLVGQAVGTVVLNRNAGPAVVARDGRLSGPYLQDAMIEGITSTGCDVLNIGAVPTGVRPMKWPPDRV
jgi:phosphomannomutase/phosphoglucomutase